MKAMTHGPFWRCDDLATAIVRRLMARYGPDITIAQSGSPGVDQSFPVACRALGVAIEYRKVEFAHAGDFRYQNREMLRPGAGLCCILHRTALDERTKDLARQAIEMGVPTYLIADGRGVPRRLKPDSGPLA
jgi:hypothetical protein